MASLLKKTFAVVLAIGLVLSCFTVSAENSTPSINVSTGYITGEETDVSVKISTDSFTAIYGSQFSITIPDGFAFVNIETKDPEGVNWVKDSNYVVKEVDGKDVITFLDVRTDKGFEITLNLTKTGTASALNPIELEPEMFIDSNEAEYSDVILKAGAISITNTTVEEGSKPESEEGYFIPYGSVETGETDVNGNPVYAEKDANGDFSEGTTVSYFKLPKEEVGVTTFGVSEKTTQDTYRQADGTEVIVEPGIQFGSYAIDTDGKTFGTIVVSGDLDAFKDFYKDTFKSDKAFYDKFVALCAQHGTVSIGYGNKLENNKYEYYIKVACVKRTTYLWKGTEGEVAGHRQYALRIVNHKQDGKYYGIGYNTADNVTYNYSENVQKYLGQ